MKKLTFSLLLACLAFASYAQQLAVLTPASIAGGKQLVYNTAWGLPLDSMAVYEAEAVYLQDTAGTTLGGAPPVNAAALANKFALVDRGGGIGFAVKCLNAFNAGAKVAVVVNNAPGAGPVAMGGTPTMPITIPCIMITYEAGQEIKAAIAAGATVTMRLGVFSYDFDVALGKSRVLGPHTATVPLSQAAADDHVFTPAALVANIGNLGQENVKVICTVNHTPFGSTTPTEVYRDSVTFAEAIESDSTEGQFFASSIEPVLIGTGNYAIRYTCVTDADESTFDNVATSQFSINDKYYSKARWNYATSRPIVSSLYTRGDAGEHEILAPLKISNGLNHKIDSVYYQLSARPAIKLINENISANLYKWEDLNQDSIENDGELTLVARQFNTFAPTDSVASVRGYWVDENFEPKEVIIDSETAVYFVGIRNETNNVFFGFDEVADYTVLTNNIAPTIADLPYTIAGTRNDDDTPSIGPGSLFTGLSSGAGLAIGVQVNMVEGISTPAKEIGTLKVYPNPVSDELRVSVELFEMTSSVNYVITDVNGRMIMEENKSNVQSDIATFNVSNLPNGQYFFKVETTEGRSARVFTVVHK